MQSPESRPPRHAEAPRADINVTPLVDVCLVLLVIFMVVTPMIRDGVGVALPEAARPAQLPDRAGQAVVAVRADRSVWLNDERVGLEGLVAALQRLKVPAAESGVLVRGDRTLQYGEVRTVFKVLADAGISRASLVTLRDDQHPAQ